MSAGNGWIGVDLDGTLAFYDGWKGVEHIGWPIPLMRERVVNWLAEGRDVRIFTARVCSNDQRTAEEAQRAREVIEAWCVLHIGRKLPVTNVKDFGMVVLYDDRCRRVEENTGVLL